MEAGRFHIEPGMAPIIILGAVLIIGTSVLWAKISAHNAQKRKEKDKRLSWLKD